jgi:hypothetical protein
MGTRFYGALVPWFVFAVVARGGGQGARWAALLALLAAVMVAAWPTATGSITGLNIGAVIVFAALVGAGRWYGGPHLEAFARAYAAGGLFLIALGSLVTVPIAEAYTRALVPPSVVGGRSFLVASREITSIWAAAFGAVASSFAAAAAIGTSVAATTFNWMVPATIVAIAHARATARWERDFDPDGWTDGLDAVGDILGT